MRSRQLALALSLIAAAILISCSASPLPPMPRYESPTARECGRSCQMNYSRCGVPCGEIQGWDSNRCFSRCGEIMEDCYQSCADD